MYTVRWEAYGAVHTTTTNAFDTAEKLYMALVYYGYKPQVWHGDKIIMGGK